MISPPVATSRSFSLIALLLQSLLFSACDDVAPATLGGEGCDALVTPCPEGTVCTLDPIGNPFCESSDVPLAGTNIGSQGGERSAGEMMAGEVIAGESVAGESVGGESVAGESLAGTEMFAGNVSAGETPAGAEIGGMTGGGEVIECGTFMVALKPAVASIPQVMLVVDRSYSMINSEDRWTPALRAISQVTQNLEEDVSFGLTLFPDPVSSSPTQQEINQCASWGRLDLICEGDLAACVEGRVLVEPAVNTSLMIRQTLNDNGPVENQATPTYSALQAAAQSLTQSASTGERVVILVTDGMPGCNFTINPTTCDCLTTAPFFCETDGFAAMCLDEDRTINEITRLAGLGIKTLVVGMTIGLPDEGGCLPTGGCPYGGQRCEGGQCVNLAPSVLGAMARAGGDATGNYFSVADVGSIESQITRATASVAPCVFDLETVPPELYDRLVVYVDGDVVASDPSRMNGWWAENGSIEFYGAACEALRDGNSHRIAARCE